MLFWFKVYIIIFFCCCNPISTYIFPGINYLLLFHFQSNFKCLFAPASTSEVVLEAGHCPHDEVPARVNAELLRWMEGLPAAPQQG